MKFQFEDCYSDERLDYQKAAIEAVCDLFQGQELNRTEFTVLKDPTDRQMRLGFAENDLGIGNRLNLLDNEILSNLKSVQMRNSLPPDSTLASGDFTVEMETGTGKTYVYLRTIFELNKRFGFTKFVIVVPSIAIKEGVYKSIQDMEEHFRNLYANPPIDYFIYDSSKLGQVRNFATSPHIQVMVVTVGAINKKDVNNLYKPTEDLGDEKPIDLIRATRPIVIVDEPQSVDGGLTGKGKEALDAMNPLCTLRYSATHAVKHHMVYRLDAVDAYERKLVKQIEIASATVEGGFNKPYVELVEVPKKKGQVQALIRLDVQTKAGIRRELRPVIERDDLEQIAGREIYRNFRIGEIRAAKGSEMMELRAPGTEQWLRPGMASGDVDELAVQREMIRRTIREHLDKEKRLRPQGIKVLSLFFIDAVEKYRRYDEDGQPVKGVYAEIFEEEYRRLAKHPDYLTLFEGVDLSRAAEEVHNGYFSIDKKGLWTNTDEGNTSGRENAQRAYELIMKKKQELLSFETPLKFIFSHSALMEGWDNPNVFQICNFSSRSTERWRRQTIGRGLRLCVNQDGVRLRGFEINTLTVVATEAYEEFAEKLQLDIETDTGIRFGVVQKDQFAAIPVTQADYTTQPFGMESSELVWDHLKTEGYIDSKGRVQDKLKLALKAGTLTVPEQFKPQILHIAETLRKIAGRLEIKNADERRTVRPRQAVLDSEEFRALWDRIKYKTTYRVYFDNEKLIEDCTKALQDAPAIPRTSLKWRKADLAIGKAGIEATEVAGADLVALDETDIELPDLLTDLQDRTQLTRRSIQRILAGSGRLNEFKRNPQQFIETSAAAINRRKQHALIDGIKYQRLGDDYYYAQELFESEELTAYLKKTLDASKSVYEQVVWEADTERDFARQLEDYEAVKVYAKLPGWFQVPTPLGSYNPDWAVLIADQQGEHLYFIVETKGSLFPTDIRPTENDKIECGKEHFRMLEVGERPAQFTRAKKLEDVLAIVSAQKVN